MGVISVFSVMDFVVVAFYFAFPNSLIFSIILAFYLIIGVFGVIVGWYEGDLDWEDLLNIIVGLYLFFKEFPSSKKFYNVIMIIMVFKGIYSIIYDIFSRP